METNRITARPDASAGQVTTFYSYDSAPVRSLALVHAAWLLAGRDGAKTPVLMIDWDLEAPGLHHYFDATSHSSGNLRGGVLELFEACREGLARAASPAQPLRSIDGAAAAQAARVLDALDWDDYIERVDDSRPLYLMRAGRLDDSYGERVDRLDWDALFGACPGLFRAFAARLAGRFSHVLVDCRSGRSAAASVCTALLPDKMVGLFTPDPRSLDGLRGVVARALEYRCSHEDEQRPLLVYPLPAPVEAAGEGRRRWRLGNAGRGVRGYQATLEKMLGESYGLGSVALDSYLDEVQLPQAGILGAPLPSGRAHPGQGDRLGPLRGIEALLEWLEPGHFPWRALAEVRLLQAAEALRRRAADPQASSMVRELARLGHLYLGQHGELEAARRIEQHVIALEAGLHAMEEGKRGHPGARPLGADDEPGAGTDGAGEGGAAAAGGGAAAAGADVLDDALSRLQELIDSRSPREARALADSLRSRVLRPSVAHPLRRRAAAMIKQVYLQEGDKDALLAFTEDEVSSLEGALIQAAGGRPLVAG
nr:tetratricopeptide repeat protein [uncultured Massilia sp.]